jgi:putative DNA primase/helicase
LDFGWSIIPVKQNKKPWRRWRHLQTRRLSLKELEPLLNDPRASALAVITGSLSGVVVTDFDGGPGMETMRRLGFQPHVMTPRDGAHVYFRHPGWHVKTLAPNGKMSQPLAAKYPGMHVRGDGGFAVFVGRTNHGEYRWIRSADWDDPPEDIFHEFSQQAEIESTPPPPSSSDNGQGRVPQRLLIDRFLEEARSLGRNNAGFRLACQLRDNQYTKVEARVALLEYRDSVGPLDLHGDPEPYTVADLDATLDQAYSRLPRDPWPEPEEPAVSVENEVPPPEEPRPNLLAYMLNDHGNALRLKAAYGDQLRYCPTSKKFLIWDSRRWAPDDTRQVVQLARSTLREFVRQAEAKGDAWKDAAKFARGSLNAPAIAHALTLLQSDVAVSIHDFDKDRYLLNTPNGTIDLRTGELREHRREDLLTRSCAVPYDPDTPDPELYLQLLRTNFGDGPDASLAQGERAERMTRFVQKDLGYSLSGYPVQKIANWVIGEKNRGKTTFLQATRYPIEEYCATILVESLMASSRESSATQSDLADLHGARLAFTSEAEEGHCLAVARLKYFTQGPFPIRACRKYELPFTFITTHTFWVDTNVRPKIRGADENIWSRLKVLPFIGPEHPKNDRFLLALQEEAPQILAWMVRGYLCYLTEGLDDPEDVEIALNEWKEESDPLREYIADRCKVGPTLWCIRSSLTEDYQDWGKKTGEKSLLTSKELAKFLRRRGCVDTSMKINRKTTRIWRGITLTSQFTSEQGDNYEEGEP